jgi:hypothetical protein
MREYDVDVCRMGYGHLTLRVQAKNAKEAKRKALDEAGNHVFSENNADYSAEGVMEVEHDKSGTSKSG